MITQDIEKRVLERLSLADEVSKYGVIVDNPGDEVWPFKAECTIQRRIYEKGEFKEYYDEKVTVLLSKSKKTFLVDDEDRGSFGDALEFLYQVVPMIPRWDAYNVVGRRDEFARMLAIKRHWNVWED